MDNVAVEVTNKDVEKFVRYKLNDSKLLMQALRSPKTTNLDGMPKGGSGEPDRMMVLYETARERVELAEAIINQLPASERTILQRMERGDSDRQIVDKIGYSESSYYHNYKPAALSHFRHVYPLDIK